jgi:hypothetical protein
VAEGECQQESFISQLIANIAWYLSILAFALMMAAGAAAWMTLLAVAVVLAAERVVEEIKKIRGENDNDYRDKSDPHELD